MKSCLVAPVVVAYLPAPASRVRRLTAAGHYRCWPGVEKLLGYYLLLEDGSQTMLTPAEFEQRFGRQNDPSKVPHLPGME